MFTRLVDAVGLTTPDELLAVLSGSVEFRSLPSKVVSDDDQIPADVQEKFAHCHEWLSNGECTKALDVFSAILTGYADIKMIAMVARLGIANSIILGAGDINRAKELLAECLSGSPEPDKHGTRSSALYLLGEIEWKGGHIDEAYSLYSASLTELAPPKPPFVEVSILMRLVEAAQALGRMTAAHPHLARATKCGLKMLVASKGDNRKAAAFNLGQCYLLRSNFYRAAGQHREAIRCVDQGELLLREGKDPDLLGQILLAKAEDCFALEREDDAFVALDEAEKCFSNCGKTNRVLACYDIRIEQVKLRGYLPEVMGLCREAIEISARSGNHREHVLCLIRMADVSMMAEQSDESRQFLARAKEVATHVHDAILLAYCVLVEVDGVCGENTTGQRSVLLRDSIAQLSRLADECNTPKERAGFLHTLGCCYQRDDSIAEAHACILEALHLFQLNGELQKAASCFLNLATLDQAQGDCQRAALELEQLLVAIENTSMYEFQREAHLRLVGLMIQLCDLDAARKHQDAYFALTGRNRSLRRLIAGSQSDHMLTHIEVSRGTPRHDLPRMLRELHILKERYPEVAAALLPFWYHSFGGELLAQCRTLFGIKFLVAASSVAVFEKFAKEWSKLGDLFIYAADVSLREENQFDWIPWPMDFLYPANVPIPVFPADMPQMNPEQAVTVFVQLTACYPYLACPISDKSIEGYPGVGGFIIGRRSRVSDEIYQMMLGQEVASLIAKRSLALPAPILLGDIYLHNGMCAAYSNGLLPVFIGAFPESREVVQERAVRIPLSAFLNGTGQELESTTVQKKFLRRFMSEVSKDPDAALMRLVEELELFSGREQSQIETRTVSVLLMKFKYGRKRVTHPVLIVDELLPKDRNFQVATPAPKRSRKR